jgi:methyl-accepting chemotaxis protein
MSAITLWRAHIERLGFREKLGLIPSVAAVALTATLLLNVVTGLLSDLGQHKIENQYYPAVKASRDLQTELRAIQRALQDAVTAGDSVGLLVADSLRRVFARTASAARAPFVDSAFAAYYTRARSASAHMIGSDNRDGELRPLDELSKRFSDIRNRLEATRTANEAAIASAFRTTRWIRRAGWVGSALVIVACILLLGHLSRLVSVSIAQPVQEAARVAARLAEGDVTVRIEVTSEDEIGTLLRSMQRMVHYLEQMAAHAASLANGDVTVEVTPRAAHDAFGVAFQQMVQYLGDMARVADRIADGDLTVRVNPRTDRDAFGRAFVSMVARLSDAMQAVREGAEAITVASTEVASSSRALSESTARDAERLEQTVSTLDEVRASAARSAEDSVAMEQVTLRAAREAVEVGAAVREMAAALQTIIRRTAIVTELASETNLLALNAAIEAARAADHGRGFAVIAHEVRDLAVRSEHAAREISQVAMNSEQIAQRSDALLSTLAPSMEQSTELVQRVAASSTHQGTEIASVTGAMNDVDSTAQRNAASAQELAATAGEMALAAEALQAMLERFKTGA